MHTSYKKVTKKPFKALESFLKQKYSLDYNYLYITLRLFLVMKFAHLGDIHLGSWRHPELQELNLASFKKAVEICIKNQVDFVLIAGDLFDSAYPSIDILKEAFSELKKLKEAKIPVYIIAGSHDYSASGKTFLDVLEKAGFCKNVHNSEKLENQDYLILNPALHENIAIYGYPGKKSSMEIQELKNLKLQEAPGYFKILMLHTTLNKAKGSLPIPSVDELMLPKADYYALGHLHIDYQDENFIYSGPVFPNNFEELEELKHGFFYLVNLEKGNLTYEKISLKLKEIEIVDLEIKNALTATEQILFELSKRELENRIILLRLSGKLEKGKISNIDFKKIEDYAKNKKAYAFLKSASKLSSETEEVTVEVDNMEDIESAIISKYSKESPSSFNKFIPSLINSLSLEKQDDEKSAVFESRLTDEVKKILNLKEKLIINNKLNS